jgi:LPXTG-site transpeptidase (sortase) family protein
MQFFFRNFKSNLTPNLLRLFAFTLVIGVVLARAPMPDAQARAGEPKLILEKTIEGGVTTAQVGDVIRYRIRFECSSLVDPCGEVAITDVLQPGLTYQGPPSSSVPAGFTITEAPAGTITIRKSDNMLLDGSQYDAVIAVKVNYDLRPLPATINNTINGTIDPPGPIGVQTALPASAPTITVDGLNPSWGLNKTLFSPTINPTVDTDVTYQISLCPTTVSGNVPLQNIVITDNLPAGAVFVSASNGGTNSSGTVTWNIPGPVTPPACATRYVTIRYPKASFPIGTSITNSASATATYLGPDGNICSPCVGITPDTITHPIDDIFDVPTYSKTDVGDPVGYTGTARFVLSLNTNGTNYPANNVMLIDNLLPDAEQLEVTEVTSGAWSAAFDYVRAYVEYSTNNGGSWTAFGGAVNYNSNATYVAPVTNITNVRWRFEYDTDRALPFDVATTQPGLPYTWSFTSNPQVRVKPRAVDTTSTNGIPLLHAVNGATYTNCVQVSRVDGDPGTPDPTIDACRNENMTVRGDYVSLRTSKAETPGVPWDDLYDPLIQSPGFISDFSILPGDTLRYTITVDMTERSSAPLLDPTILDMLPADLVFVRNGTATLDGGAVVQPTFTQVGQNLKWTWDTHLGGPGLTVPTQALGSHLLQVEFFARIPRGQAPGMRTNNLYVTTDSLDVLCEIAGTQSTDTGNIDGDGNSAEAACKTTDTYIVERSAALRGEKWIRSNAAQNSLVVRYDTFAPPAGTPADPACPNGGNTGLAGGGTNNFTRYPCVSRAYPEKSFINGQFVPPPTDPTLDDFEYNLRIFNDGNVGMIKYVLYDILPYYGDKGSGGTLADSARDSQFRTVLRGPIQFISGTGLTAANFTIEYNLTTNPCRPEVFNQPSGAIPSGCDNSWITTAATAGWLPADWATVRSYRIRLNNGSLIQPSTSASELRFGVPMSILADAPAIGAFNSDDPQSYEIAWNSFSHVGSYTDLTSTVKDLLASEPRKVGITIPEMMSIGNRVWRDSDNSGTINAPDDTDPGIGGVIVNLYRDTNNDGDPDGAAIATTTTDYDTSDPNNLDKGYYLFSNIPYDSVTPGNNLYIVGIPAINFGSADPDGAGPLTQGALYTLRSSTGTPANIKYTTTPLDANVDMEDHGKDPAILNQEVFSPTITLQPNTEDQTETDLSDNDRDGIAGARRGVNGEANPDSDLTVDFGFFGGIDVPFSIGNHLWYDNGSGGGILNNGIRDGSEPPVANARVELYRDGDKNGILLPSEMIRFDVTDANGFYLFDNLDPGDYYVLVAPGNFSNALFDPDGTTNPLPAAPGVLGGWFSSQPTGTETTGVNGGTMTADIDSDDNGVNNDTPEVQGIRSGKVVLERGVPEPLTESHLSLDSSMTLGFNPTAGDGNLNGGHIGRYGETDATSNMTIDFGFIPPMSLGNRLWIDDGAGVSTNYNNGIMDSGELGVNGARVELWRDTNITPGLQLTAVGPIPADTFVRYATTDSSGYYLFDYIQPSNGAAEPYDYFVHIPASNFVTGGALLNYVSSSVTDTIDNSDDMDDNGFDSVTPMSTGITSPLIEMGYGTESITETDIPAAGYGTGGRGSYGAQDANSNLTVDFGFVSPMSLGNRVWRDSDNSGTINAPDNANPGIANVVVNLYSGVDANSDGIPDDLTVLATDTTDAGGYYLFSNLSAGNYIVGIPAGNFAADPDGAGPLTAGPLYSLKSSTGTPPVATYTTPADSNPDQADHGRDPVLAGSAVYSPIINLAVGAEPVAESDLSGNPADGIASRGINGEQDNNSDLTVDFGFYGAEIPFSIGNHLWKDDGSGGGTINNGIRDGGEPAVAGARVELYRDGDGSGTPEAGEFMRFDVTDAGGFYLFDNLDPGTYFVLVANGNFTASFDVDDAGPLLPAPGVLQGWYSSQLPIPPVGGNAEVGTDSDDDGIDTNTPETNGVYSGPIVLIRGTSEPLTESYLSLDSSMALGFNPTAGDGNLNGGHIGRYGETDATSNVTIDFGFIPPMSLGNRLWIDDGAGITANFDNGIMDSGEPGVSGATVELWRDNGNGTLEMSGAGADTPVGTAITNSQGYYLFERLQHSSNYFVHVPASNFVAGGALLNYISSTVTDTIDNSDDKDDNGIDSVTPMSTGITSPLIAMAYGTESITESDIPPNTPANVTAYGVDRRGLFGQGDSNSNLTVDFGFIAPMSLGNRVWRDSDNSGTINAPDNANPGIANVVVNLYSGVDANSDGIPDNLTILATDTTDANGYYLFSNLPAGNYIVGIPDGNFAADPDGAGPLTAGPLYSLKSSTGTPSVTTYTTPADSNPDQSDHGRDPILIGGAVYSPIINLAVGTELTSETDFGPEVHGTHGEQDNNSDLTVDFGFYGGATPFSIGNHLWKDDGGGVSANINNGIRDGGEPAVAGARVELYRDGNGNNTPEAGEFMRFDVTDANGFYLFDNLDPATYFVLVAPGNFTTVFDPDGAGILYPPAPGVLQGWYSSQLPIPPVGGNAEVGADNDDDGIDTDTPEVSGVRSSAIILENGVSEPTTENYWSNNSIMTTGDNPTAGDGTGHIGRFGEVNSTSNISVDFGFIPPMSLGNRVWIDDGAGVSTNYNNGIMDSGETGVSSVRVELWRDTNTTAGLQVSGAARDTFIRYTTTDVNGYYLFERLQPGSNYYVHIRASNFDTGGALQNYISSHDQTNPVEYETTDKNDNGFDNVNNPLADGVTSAEITMVYNNEPLTIPTAGYIETDINSSGAYGPNNVGTLGQTDSNSNLTMDFGFVRPPRSIGNYLWRDTGTGAGGVVNDGIHQSGELPVPLGVRVSLYRDTNSDGIPDDISGTPANLTDDWLAFDLTDANGYYLFDNLPPGQYLIGVNGDNFDAGGLTGLVGYTSSTGNVDNASNNLDNHDNGIDPSNPTAAVSPYGILSTTIDLTTLPLTGLPTGETVSGDTGTVLTNNPTAGDGASSIGRYGEADANSDLTIDFGFVEAYALGNHVWFDTDNDGVMDVDLVTPANSEQPIAGVQVALYHADAGGNPTTAVMANGVARTAVTSVDGYYLFDYLAPGDYVVVITADNFDDTGATDTYKKLVGYWSSRTTISGTGVVTEDLASTPDPDNDVDLDDNGTRQTSGALNNAVISKAVTLGPTGLTEPTNDDDLQPLVGHGSQPDDRSNLSVDFGFYKTAIGNLVYKDVDVNGTYGGTDTLLNGVTVRLYAQDGITEIPVGPDGILGTADDLAGGVVTGPTAAHLTWGNGEYYFSGLPAGDYIVKVTTPNGMLSTIDTNPQNDNDNPNWNVDNNDNGDGIGTGTSGIITSDILIMTPGGGTTPAPAAKVNVTVAQSSGVTTDNTLDFGFVDTYSLGNRVWFDTNNNGVLDAAEVGINGVRVELYYDTDGNNAYTPGVDQHPAANWFTTTAVNGGNGYYRFDNLIPDEYIVVLPGDNFRNVGAGDNVAGDPLMGYWSTGTYFDSATPTGTVSESATNDPDNNFDASATVATSDDNGVTTFNGNKVNYVASTAITLGGDLEPITDNDPVTNPQAGEASNLHSNRTVDFGFYRTEIGNLVFHDDDQSGHFNGSDAATSNIVVRLYDANNHEVFVGPDGILGTDDDAAGGVTTGPLAVSHPAWLAGEYHFSGLPAGGYVVKITLPVGSVSSIDSNPQNDNDNPNWYVDNNDNGDGVAGGIVTSDTTNFLVMTPGDGTRPNATPKGIAPDNATGTTVDNTMDFGFVELVAIGNRVWFDTGTGGGTVNNGRLDGSELGVNNVTVELYNTGADHLMGGVGVNADTLADTTTTASIGANAGYYQFDNLLPGWYYVKIPASEFISGGDLYGYVSSRGNGARDNDSDQGIDENGIDGTPANPLTTAGIVTPVYTLARNSEPFTDEHVGIYSGVLDNDNVNFTADFSFVQAYALGNRVWFDTNNNGLIDDDGPGGNPDEVGVDGVQVQLFRASGTLPTGTALDTRTTANGGYYLFDNLTPGNYVVVITADNFIANGTFNALVGYWSSRTAMSATGTTSETAAFDPDFGLDGISGNGDDNLDSNDDNGTRDNASASTFYRAVLSLPVTLGPNGLTEPLSETQVDAVVGQGLQPDGRANMAVDFGFYRTAIGNLVFEDVNLDGEHNTSPGIEPIIANVPVTLYSSNGTQILVGADGILGTADDGVNPVLTNASGNYLFTGLPEGDYIIRIVTPAGGISTVDTSDSVDTGNPDTNTDENDNGVGEGTGTISSNTTNPLTTHPGLTGAQAKNTVDQTTGTTTDPTIDFGIVPGYGLGNRVWFDTNNNGVMDGAEVGVPNVVVNLYAANVAGNPTGSILANDTTNASGFYLFDDLFPRDYVVVINKSNFATGGVLAGYWSSGTVISGGVPVENLAPAAPAPDPDTDLDIDDNGTRDTSADPVFGGAVISKAVTLGGVTPEPIGEVAAQLESGVLGNQGNQPDTRANMTVDFGFYKVAIGNLVFMDNNVNGTYDDGVTAPINAVVIRLYDSAGNEIQVGPDGILGTADDATGGVVTGSNATHPAWLNGEYHFNGLPAGDYIVRVTAPAGTYSTIDNGTPARLADSLTPDNNLDDNDNGIGQGIGTVSANTLTMTPGEFGNSATGITTDNTLDFGFVNRVAIGNRVWFDTGAGTPANANNGRLDAGELGVNGVAVELYNTGPDGLMGGGDDTLAGTTTTATVSGNPGVYQFDNLYPGKYYVKIPASMFDATLPSPLLGYVSSVGNGLIDVDSDQGIDENGIDGINRTDLPTNGIVTPVYTLMPGTEPTTPADEYTPIYTGSLADANVNFTADFGFVQLVAIGNRIWFDDGTGIGGIADDGIQQTGELGVSGVRVELYYDTNNNNVYNPGVDQHPATNWFTTTDVSGNYVFDNLVPGKYFVHIPASEFDTPVTDLLYGYISSTDTAAKDEVKDENADENGMDAVSVATAPITAGVTSNVFDLTVGGETQADNETSYTGYLDDANVNFTADFGFVQKVALGNLVWLDNGAGGGTANDGIRNGTESGINGVDVYLYLSTQTAGDIPFRSTTTDVNGRYIFDNLQPGQYFVWIPGTEFNAGQPLVNLLSSTGNGGVNNDNDQNADENGIDQPTPSATGISTPIYTLAINAEPTADDDAGYNGALDDDNVNLTADFGFTELVAIGNRIWFDTGAGAAYNNGVLDAGESGVPNGVTVELRRSSDNSLVATTTTTTIVGNPGYYQFNNLLPGSYYVQIPSTEFDTSTDSLYGYVSSLGGGAAGDNDDQTADENGVDADPLTAGIHTPAYNLQPNTMPTGDEHVGVYSGNLDSDNVNFTADFGFVQLVGIGNRLWYDDGAGTPANANNGKFDTGEAGVVNGVVVELYNAGLDGAIGGGDDTLAGTTTTVTVGANSGYYQFDNLNPGRYYVHIPASMFDATAPSPLQGFHSSTDPVVPVTSEMADQGTDENGIDTANLAVNGINGMVYNLQPNTEPSPATTDDDDTGYTGYLDDDNVNFTADFGFYNIVAIGNRVWLDNGAGGGTANDGIQNGSEAGVNGVRVELYSDTNSSGAYEPAIDQHPATNWFTTTNATGYYVFDNLLAGTYFVHIPASNFAASQPLEGYYSSQGNGADETSDQNVDENGVDQPTPATSGITSTPYTLSANTEPSSTVPATDDDDTGYTGVLDDDDVNFTADFGFVQKYALGNRVWFDTNNNANMDSGEVGVNGVTVQLWTDPNNDNNPSDGVQVGPNVTTANGGYYLFDNIYPGNYVVVIPPANFSGAGRLVGYWSSLTTMGATGTTTETAAPDPDLVQGIPGPSDDDIDLDDNGTRSALAGFNGAVISRAVTIGPDGNTEPTDEDAAQKEPVVGDGSQPNGRSNLKVDFGFYKVSVGDLVFSDGVKDGTYIPADDAELPDVLVHLFASNGTSEIITGADGALGTADDLLGPDGQTGGAFSADDNTGGMFTDASGQYQFGNLPRGTYIVRVDSPVGTSSTIDTFDTNDTTTTGPDANTNNNDNGQTEGVGPISSAPFTLIPGAAGIQSQNTITNSNGTTHNPTLDFGFIPAFSLGNRVWFDTDDDGVIDFNASGHPADPTYKEVGINGVTVEVYAADASGNPTGPVLDTDVTVANGTENGYYLFNPLPAGNYVVVIPDTNFTSGVLQGYWSSGLSRNPDGSLTETAPPDPDNGISSDIDSDDNGMYRPSAGDVVSKPVTLGPNPTEPTAETDNGPLGQGQPNNRANMTVDFGFYTMNIGDVVWNDVDNSGAVNGAEAGFGGVDVELWSADGSQMLGLGTITTAGGIYGFSGLPQGDYIVRIPASEFSTGGTLEHYVSSTGTNSIAPPVALGPNEPAPDADVNFTDFDDNGSEKGGTLGLGGYIQSETVTLNPTSESAYDNVNGSTSETRVDFGVFRQDNHLPLIGIAKNLVSSVEVSPGTYQVIYDILVQNMGDVPLNSVQVTDDLSATFTAPTTVSVVSRSAVGLTINPAYSGIGNLLAGTDSLAVGASGTIRLVINVVPYASGPFQNTAIASGVNPFGGATVTDRSQNGTIPDLDGDGNPTNDNVPTPVDFGPNLFDPPIGFKVFDASGLPLLRWTMTWINSTNIAAVNARVSDPIPDGTTYAGGVTCLAASAATTTTLCYYEAPTAAYPLGRVVWEGVLGPDFGHTTAATAVNELDIVFNVSVPYAVTTVYNVATIDTDLNGNGIYAPSELAVANSQSIWVRPAEGGQLNGRERRRAKNLPSTGFAPGVVTILPEQPADKAYFDTGGVGFEIPRLGINTSIVGIPQADDGSWDVSWLWQQTGWLQGTAYPTLAGNSVITGHVYLPNGKPGPFVDVNKLTYGDKIIIHANGQKYIYEVRDNKTVKPNDVSVLKNEDKAWITLITCLGYNEANNTYASRVAVKAVLIAVEKEETSTAK